MKEAVLILCGGRGTRMGTLTDTVPKPMISVGGKPLLWHVMQSYARQGHQQFYLCLGYRGEMIRSWFLQGGHLSGALTLGPQGEQRWTHTGDDPSLSWEVTMMDTGRDTLTGERLRRMAPLLGDSGTLLMTYGDGVSDVDLSELLRVHRESGALVTVSAMRARSRFGVLELEGHQVRSFEEKPVLRQRVSGGFFAMELEALSWIQPGEAFEQGALGRLAAAGQLAACRHDGFWLSVDTPRDRMELEKFWERGERPWLAPSS